MKGLLITALFVFSYRFAYAQHLHLESTGQPQNHPLRVTELHIREVTMFASSSFFITSDSIKVKNRQIGSTFTDTAFVMRMTLEQRNWLLAPFDNIYLSTVQPDYYRSSVRIYKHKGKIVMSGSTDHAYQYHLAIYKGNNLAVTDIYKAKVDYFFTFSQRLNQLLPSAYRIRYTSNYFNKE